MNYGLGSIYPEKKNKKRKPFKISTKKMEWMSAAGKDPLKWRSDFVKTSKCRECPLKLKWGDRTYDFDHKDNNSANNNQRNCYLVCKTCHGKHTKISVRKIKDKFMGTTVGYKTIKNRVGYKKEKKKKPAKKVDKRKRQPKQNTDFFSQSLVVKSPKIKPLKINPMFKQTKNIFKPTYFK